MHLYPVSNIVSFHSEFDWVCADTNVKDITQLKEHYRCPCFCILIIGRANAGKTTILEKVCAVAKGTKPIIVYDKKGKLDERPLYFLIFIPARSRTGNRYEAIN
jgi:stage III sporulation protein SpoIIIAA